MAGTVTVVIPTYRNPGTLARAVESVLAQDYTDLRCLVINAWQARERLWAAIHKTPTPDLAGHPSMQPHPDTAHSLTRDTARLREVLAPEAVA